MCVCVCVCVCFLKVGGEGGGGGVRRDPCFCFFNLLVCCFVLLYFVVLFVHLSFLFFL